MDEENKSITLYVLSVFKIFTFHVSYEKVKNKNNNTVMAIIMKNITTTSRFVDSQ